MKLKKFKILLAFAAVLAFFSFSAFASAVTILPLYWFPNDGAVVSNPFVFEVRCFIQDGTHNNEFYESNLCQCSVSYQQGGVGPVTQIALPIRSDGVYRSNTVSLVVATYTARYTCLYGSGNTPGVSPQITFTVSSTPTPTPTPTPSAPPSNRYLTGSKRASPTRVFPGQKVKVSINLTGAGDPGDRSLLDTMLVLDRSGSMTGTTQGSSNNKLTDAKIAARAFVGNMNFSAPRFFDKIGLVSFSATVILHNQLTHDSGSVNTSIDNLQADATTNIGDAIYNASAELASSRSRSSALKVMLLLTDGRANEPYNHGVEPSPLDEEYALNAARAAAAANYTIYVIGLGDDVNPDFLQQIADITHGEYYFAPSSSELRQIFLNISNQLINTAASRVTIADAVPENVDFRDSSASECSYDAAGRIFKCYRNSILLGESWLVSLNVSTESQGFVPTNEQCTYSYIAANGLQQSGSLASPRVYVMRPRVLLATQPSWDYGPFPSTLTADFYDISEGAHQANFDCGNGQTGSVPFQVSYQTVLPDEPLARVQFSCLYPLVDELRYFKAKVDASFTVEGRVHYVHDEKWIEDYPRYLGIRDAAPVNGALVPAGSVEFKATCYSYEINGGASLADCSCTAYYWNRHTIPQPVPLRLDYSGCNEPYYHAFETLPVGTFYEYFRCTRGLLSVQTPNWWFVTYGGSANITLAANPSSGTGSFPSSLRAEVRDIPPEFHSSPVVFDCGNGEPTENASVTWSGNNGFAIKPTNCVYQSVPSITRFTASASIKVKDDDPGSIVDKATVTDNPSGYYVTISNPWPFNGIRINNPFNFSVSCVVNPVTTPHCQTAGLTPKLSFDDAAREETGETSEIDTNSTIDFHLPRKKTQ